MNQYMTQILLKQRAFTIIIAINFKIEADDRTTEPATTSAQKAGQAKDRKTATGHGQRSRAIGRGS